MSYREVFVDEKTGSIVPLQQRVDEPVDVKRYSDVHIVKSVPATIYEGTESGARKFTAKEDGGKYIIRNETDGIDEVVIDPSNDVVNVRRDVKHAGTGHSLLSHAARHNRGGDDAIDWSSISKWLNKSASGVSIGTSGSPASILRVDVESNYYNLLFKYAKVTPSNLGTGESVTYHIIFHFSDGTDAEVATLSGVTAETVVTDADIDWSKIPDGARVVAIEITAESSATSTSATSDAVIVALEF